ncbi:EamA family transporter [Yoonia sp. 208BN28-4]|uniref:EamA family transporter n=1 Tax=Yoonia sp. 208BN28-4 TaxID=3126505 RepID=UPI0030AB3C75
MELWIYITFAAALAQSLRFMLQKQLKSAGLSTAGATFARFVFAAPLVALIAMSYAWFSGQGLPKVSPVFFAYAIAGGTSQILATMCVVALFSLRNFAVGITFKKTEVLLSVLIGFVILGDAVTVPALIAIFIGLAGVLLLSDPPNATGRWHKRILNKAVALGLLSGLLFGFSGVFYRGASLSIAEGDTFYRATIAMMCVTAYQVLVMTAWLRWREAGEIGKVLVAWRKVALTGLASMIGTMCWFSAFTLQTAGYVNAVGQVELIFSIAIGAMVFGERITAREWQGLLLLTGSIVLLVLVV